MRLENSLRDGKEEEHGPLPTCHESAFLRARLGADVGGKPRQGSQAAKLSWWGVGGRN